MLKTLLNESRNMMVLKKSFRALGAIKSIEKGGVIVHGTYYNATIAVYVTLNLRLGKDEVSGSNPLSSSNINRLNRKV